MNGKSAIVLCLHVLHQPDKPESFSKKSEKLLHFYFVLLFYVSHIQPKADACTSNINRMAGLCRITTYLQYSNLFSITLTVKGSFCN